MGREIRRVPGDWDHPQINGEYIPLLDGYKEDVDGFMSRLAENGLQSAIDYYGQAPDINDYMPEWDEKEKTHIQMYETCSEGTPISPTMETGEELARWLTDNNASAFGEMTATFEQWLATINQGFAPSAVITGGKLQSGVEHSAKGLDNDT